MTLQEIIDALKLNVLTEQKDFSALEVKKGYCSDLLSCVMTGAEPGGLWVTLMAHGNIVAVAALLDLAAIIITEDAQPDPETLKKANEKGVIILASPKPNFHVVGQLWELDIRAS
jgi:hypothetical protein